MTEIRPIKPRSKQWKELNMLAFRFFDREGLKWEVCMEEAKYFAQESSKYLNLRAQELMDKGNARDSS